MKRTALIQSLEAQLEAGEVLKAVEYSEEGWSHAHHWYGLVEPGMSVGELLEEAADELLGSIEHCSALRHNGHGQPHPHVNQKQLFREVSDQLLGRDTVAELKEMVRKMKVYDRWGGQPPKIVLMPDEHDPKQLNLMIVDDDGTPFIYKTNKKARDLLPPPEVGKNAVKTEFGYQRKRRLKGSTKLGRLHNGTS